MKTCVVLDDYQDAALQSADWSRIADRVSVSTVREFLANEDAVVERIGDAEIVCIMRERTPFPASLLDRLPKLKLIVTSGMRNAAIDLAAAQKNGVTVSGTATSGSPPLELTWGLILGLARQIAVENAGFRANGPWQSSVGVDLNGRQLGIIGLGKIGTQMAKVAGAFGMKVVAWSPNLTDERAAAAGVERAASKEALLETSDFVSLHLVLAPSTRGLIGEQELRRMKPEAFLINTARAPIVDQAALIRALEEKWIAGAGLDVFETEPLPAGHPFRTLGNVLATPHLGYVSQNNYRTFFGEGIEDIEAWLDGAPIRTLV
ncbi:D-2-hydroxyacid dehydrogenase family protein [Sphingobium phenoxybenzoativorans]|uniref:D-2-hydroxyacid dehydrogenase family protein n=1 Tax=Sphingobium phenoxybenzoativorans TaxID=1592790 RepID=A0A975Q1T8_9SPHN|nr:D-2-hydroxyacid dehydrogenase family protein [Sphingobium phenoxybenzoativorans]QUT05728.1 D-2-hydroxyacid dehydrogenase family protein [Sphingobium phenoxybenzoativorans]